MKNKKFSSFVTNGLDKAPNRAMLRAVGFTNPDFNKPIIGIASTWAMVTPCNMHIDGLANQAAKGANTNGGKAVIFNTITVSSICADSLISVNQVMQLCCSSFQQAFYF